MSRPRLRRRDSRHEMAENERTQRRRKHIFCINSHPDFLQLLRDVLEDQEYNVTTTNFVPETYDQISALQPELLIIDLVIGTQGGWELLEHLTREATTNGIPLLITSTDPDLLDEAQADPARYGGGDIITKPFRADELLESIKELIGQP